MFFPSRTTLTNIQAIGAILGVARKIALSGRECEEMNRSRRHYDLMLDCCTSGHYDECFVRWLVPTLAKCIARQMCVVGTLFGCRTTKHSKVQTRK